MEGDAKAVGVGEFFGFDDGGVGADGAVSIVSPSAPGLQTLACKFGLILPQRASFIGCSSLEISRERGLSLGRVGGCARQPGRPPAIPPALYLDAADGRLLPQPLSCPL